MSFLRQTLGRHAPLLLALAGSMHWSASPAQVPSQPRAPVTIGVVHLAQRPEAPVVIGLREGLKGMGYIEGKDFRLDIRASRGSYDAAVRATEELAKKRVAVLVSAGTVATKAVHAAAGSVPVVFTQVGEPVGAGFVKSLSRPGGRMTGFSHLLADTTGKRLELLKELVPSCQNILVIYDPKNPTSRSSIAVARMSASKMGVTLHERNIGSQDEVIKALDHIDRKTTHAILILPDSLVTNLGQKIIEVSQSKYIPVMFHEETWVQRGGLASYGASFTELGRDAARYVEKILNGANPADLPVQQATKFELVINMKAARALNIAVPESVLLRAHKVIQ